MNRTNFSVFSLIQNNGGKIKPVHILNESKYVN